MSSNNKEYQKTYMRKRRQSKTLQKIINSLREHVKEYVETLRERVKDGKAEPLRECVKEFIEPLQECVKELQKPLRECVKELPGENGEIRSKTAILPENGGIFNASPVLVGGRGDVFLNNNTNKSNNSIISTLTHVEVKRGLGTKEKTYKKEKNFSTKNIKIYAPDFEIFYKTYPNKNGKDSASKYWERFRKAGSLPDLVYLLACVDIFKRSGQWQRDDGCYIPMCSSWVYKRRWVDIPEERVKAYIEQNKAWQARKEEEAAKAEEKAREREKKEVAEHAEYTRKKAESLEKLKSLALPATNEWRMWDANKKHNFCMSLHQMADYITIYDINEEIERREKLKAEQPAADADRRAG